MARTPVLILAILLLPFGLPAQEVIDLSAGDRILSMDTVPVMVLGTLDGPDWAQFESLRDAAFAPDGTLYLLDAAAPRVVAVAPDGSLRHQVGRQGEGPGEYRWPESVDVLPDGRVVVFDSRKRAFLTYDSDGTHLDEVRPDLSEGVPTGPMEPMTDGSLLALPLRMVTSRLGAAMVTGRGTRSVGTELPILRVPVRDDAPATVFAGLPVPESLGDATSVLRAFVPEPSFGVLGTEIALADNTGYAIEVVTADGVPARTLRRPLEPRPTSSRDRDSFLEALGSSRPTRIGQRGTPTSGRPAPEPWFHPFVAPTMDVKTDGDRALWVLRSHPSDATRPGPIDVLSSEGEYLGTLDAEFRTLPAAFGPGGLVAFFDSGAFDEPLVRVYRLPEALGH